MQRPKPSVEKLRKLFVYEPETGVLSRTDGTNPCRINKRGYLCVQVERSHLYVHTVAWAIMTGHYPAATIDHKDVTYSNNKWSNLRLATQAQQQVNRRLFKNHKTGFRGVYPQGKRFKAMIRFDKKTYHLGTFDTAEEAAVVVQEVRELRWGEFAKAA